MLMWHVLGLSPIRAVYPKFDAFWGDLLVQ